MTIDKDSPQLIAYRLELQERALESVGAKVDGLHLKFDTFKTDVSAKLCPQPGACLQLTDIADRLERAQEDAVTRISALETAGRDTKSFVRGAVWVAGGVGALLAMIAPAAFAGIKALFLSKP
jgi:hypothetical protein